MEEDLQVLAFSLFTRETPDLLAPLAQLLTAVLGQGLRVNAVFDTADVVDDVDKEFRGQKKSLARAHRGPRLAEQLLANFLSTFERKTVLEMGLDGLASLLKLGPFLLLIVALTA